MCSTVKAVLPNGTPVELSKSHIHGIPATKDLCRLASLATTTASTIKSILGVCADTPLKYSSST